MQAFSYSNISFHDKDTDSVANGITDTWPRSRSSSSSHGQAEDRTGFPHVRRKSPLRARKQSPHRAPSNTDEPEVEAWSMRSTRCSLKRSGAMNPTERRKLKQLRDRLKERQSGVSDGRSRSNSPGPHSDLENSVKYQRIQRQGTGDSSEQGSFDMGSFDHGKSGRGRSSSHSSGRAADSESNSDAELITMMTSPCASLPLIVVNKPEVHSEKATSPVPTTGEGANSISSTNLPTIEAPSPEVAIAEGARETSPPSSEPQMNEGELPKVEHKWKRRNASRVGRKLPSASQSFREPSPPHLVPENNVHSSSSLTKSFSTYEGMSEQFSSTQEPTSSSKQTPPLSKEETSGTHDVSQGLKEREELLPATVAAVVQTAEENVPVGKESDDEKQAAPENREEAEMKESKSWDKEEVQSSKSPPTSPSHAAVASHTSPSHTSPPHTSPPHTSPSPTSPSHTSPPHTSPSQTSPSHTSPPHTSPFHTSPPHISPQGVLGMEPLASPGIATVEEKEPPNERSYGQTEAERPVKRTSIRVDDNEIRRKRERALQAVRRGRVNAPQQEHSEDPESAPQPVPAKSHSLPRDSFMEEKEGSETPSHAHGLLAKEPSIPLLPQEQPSSVPNGQPIELKEDAPQPSNENGGEAHQFRRKNATRSERRLHRGPVSPTPDSQHHDKDVEQITTEAPSQPLQQAEDEAKDVEGSERSLEKGSTLGEITRKREKAQLAARSLESSTSYTPQQQECSKESEPTSQSVTEEQRSPTHGSSKEQSEIPSLPTPRRRTLVVQPSKPRKPLPESPEKKVEQKEEAPQSNDGDEKDSLGKHQFRRRNATRSERRGSHRRPASQEPPLDGGNTGAVAPTQSLRQTEVEEEEREGLQRGSTLEGDSEMRKKKERARLAARRVQRGRLSTARQRDQVEEPGLN